MSRAHARLAPGHHHRTRHRPDPRLGHVVLFPRGAGAADRRRHRLVAGLGGQRHLDRAAGRGADRAARSARSSTGTAAGRCSRSRRCSMRPGFAASVLRRILPVYPARLGGARRRHGHRALRRGVRGARQALRPGRADADHQSDAVRRLCLDRVLAAQRVSGREFRLAQRVPGLCGLAPDRLAAVADGGDAAARESTGQPCARRGRWRTGAIVSRATSPRNGRSCCCSRRS